MSSDNCHKCNRAIVDSGVMALGQKWHTNCFVCQKCSRGFDKGFLQVAGRPFHKECAPDEVEVVDEHNQRTCFSCNAVLGEGKVAHAFGRQYHANCFRCFSCGQVIADGAVDEWEGQICHEKCTPIPQCFVCKKPCDTGKTVVLEGRAGHESCISCHKCKKAFQGAYSEVEGELYHPQCVPDEVAKQGPCEICNRALSDPAVEVEGKVMHKDCFTCHECKKPFVSSYTKIHGKFYHEQCGK